jgi:DNA-binding IclR family transcriptional regulator
MAENFRDIILDTLRSHPQGLTIAEISDTIGVNRLTVSKYIYGLIVEDAIYQRRIGSAKLCLAKECMMA